MNVGYTLGRLVFHAMPLVMPALAVSLDRVAGEPAGMATDRDVVRDARSRA